MISNVNAGARLDRLPIGPLHRKVLLLVGLGMLFDTFDNTLSSSVLAAMLGSHWSTLNLNSYFMSATFFGLMVGAAFAGFLSDRYGRRLAYQFNLAIFGIMSFASAFAPSMHWLIAIRFVMGVGMGAEYVMGYGLITEFLPPGKRGRYLGLLGIFSGAGLSISAVTGMVIIPWLGWRAMFIIGGVGTLWVWWLRRHLPESPRWLERMGRGAEADEILQHIEQEAGPLPAVAPSFVVAADSPQSVTLTVLFTPPVIRRTLLVLVLNVTCLFGSYGVTGWMPTFFVSQGMSVTRSLGFNAAMMTGYFFGPLICAIFADRISRRWGLVLFALICAGFAAVYPFLAEPVLIIAGGFLLVAAVAAFLTLGLGGSSELFPTEYRFRAAGLAQTVGRAVLIISPFIVLTLFRDYGVGGVIGAISGMYLIVAVFVAIAGIETNRKSLEALEPDAMPDESLETSAAPRYP